MLSVIGGSCSSGWDLNQTRIAAFVSDIAEKSGDDHGSECVYKDDTRGGSEELLECMIQRPATHAGQKSSEYAGYLVELLEDGSSLGFSD
jgi:hypothetical protein